MSENGQGNGKGNGGALPLMTKQDFQSDQETRWCPGCGDYAILASVQALMPELGVPPEKTVFISGIGCAGRFVYYMDTYGMHGIHGRALALATGIATARDDLSVWVVSGDGDALSIGGNHLIHALRRNVPIKLLLFNNQIYGLTKGQYSPTSEKGKITKSTPFGSEDHPFNPAALALGAEASFVARTIDVEKKHVAATLRAAAEHEGSAFVEIYQNCNVFNDGAFDAVRGKEGRPNQIQLEHDEPIRFGAENEHGVIRRRRQPRDRGCRRGGRGRDRRPRRPPRRPQLRDRARAAGRSPDRSDADRRPTRRQAPRLRRRPRRRSWRRPTREPRSPTSTSCCTRATPGPSFMPRRTWQAPLPDLDLGRRLRRRAQPEREGSARRRRGGAARVGSEARRLARAPWQERGEVNASTPVMEEALENVGAEIMGRNMFGGGPGPWPRTPWNGWWGDEPPFHLPVFVLTHHEREPLEMEGGTTFHFVTDGIESALEQAKEAAGGKDVPRPAAPRPLSSTSRPASSMRWSSTWSRFCSARARGSSRTLSSRRSAGSSRSRRSTPPASPI